jgi:hypothetical protein
MIPWRVQKLFENWENSRAMLKRNWRVFFSVLEGSTCWFSVSTREANFFFVYFHHFCLFGDRIEFFFSAKSKQRKRDSTSENWASRKMMSLDFLSMKSTKFLPIIFHSAEEEFSENQQNYQLAIPGLSSKKIFFWFSLWVKKLVE